MSGGDSIQIIKTKQYEKDFKKQIISKHLNKELETIVAIENFIKNSENMKEVINNPTAQSYNIKKKSGNLKEIYTANINKKIRLYMKPVGKYPYELVEIEKIEFVEIDSKHYGEG